MINSNPAAGKKRHTAVTALLVVWTVIKTVFVCYAVVFTLAATVLLYTGYQKAYHYY